MKIPLRSPVTFAFTLGLAAACATPAILNPDPQHGGPCHNGDMLCTPCRGADGATWGCPDGYSCALTHGGCIEDDVGPDMVGGARIRDAGADQ